MFKNIKKIEFRGRICEVVATECPNINHHIWYKNVISVKELRFNQGYPSYKFVNFSIFHNMVLSVCY